MQVNDGVLEVQNGLSEDFSVSAFTRSIRSLFLAVNLFSFFFFFGADSLSCWGRAFLHLALALLLVFGSSAGLKDKPSPHHRMLSE